MDDPVFEPLPTIDNNSDIQRLSFNELQHVIGIDLFLVRDQRIDDYGVDLTLEARRGGKATNLKAEVQMKGTTQPTITGKGIRTRRVKASNLNYLLNSHVALYVLHDQVVGDLFYAWAFDEYKRIKESNPNWLKQDWITIEFTRSFKADLQQIWERIIDEQEAIRRARESLGTFSTIVSVPSLVTGSTPPLFDDLDLDEDPRGLFRWAASSVLIHLDNGDPDRALASVDELLADTNGDKKVSAFASALRGRVLLWKGDFTGAITAFRKAQDLSSATKFRISEALALINSNALDGVEKMLLDILELRPSAYGLTVLFSLYKLQGRDKESLDLLQRFKIEPTPDTAFDFDLQRAGALLRSDHTDEGLKLLRELGGNENSRPIAEFNFASFLGYFGYSTGNHKVVEEALLILGHSLERLHVDRYTPPEAVREIRHAFPNIKAQFLMDLGRTSEAIEILEETVNATQARDVKSQLAMMYAIVGRHEDAEELINEVERAGGADSESFLYYSSIYKIRRGVLLSDLEENIRILDGRSGSRWLSIFVRAFGFTKQALHEQAAVELVKVVNEPQFPLPQRQAALMNALCAYFRADDLQNGIDLAINVDIGLHTRGSINNAIATIGILGQRLSESKCLDALRSHNVQARLLLERILVNGVRFHEEPAVFLVREYAHYSIASRGPIDTISWLHDAIAEGTPYQAEVDDVIADISRDLHHLWPQVIYSMPDIVDINQPHHL